jgi:hypothetical protein
MNSLIDQVEYYILKLQAAIPSIHEEIEKANIEVSFYDKSISELYHSIENENALFAIRYYLPLRSVLKKRREAKYRYNVLCKVRDSVFGLPERLQNYEIKYFKDNPNYKDDFPTSVNQ